MDAFLSQPCFASHTQLLINLGLVHKNGECLTYWEPWRERMKQSGWRFFGWYVWDQGNGLPGNWAGRLAPSHEFVFHFNRESRQPNKFVRSKTGGKAKLHGSTMRGEDGKCRQKTGAGKLVAEFKIPDSVVRTYREMRRGIDHPAVYPVALASHLLAAYSNISESILDPFMGSGTTGVACVKTGRRFIGIEKEPKYFEIAKRRIEEALNATPLLAEVA
jgi:DNA modification methylase